MDLKKMKLILAASIALNVALVVIMLVLKSDYKEQAQVSYGAATKAYTDKVSQVVKAQNDFIKSGNNIWQIIFETTSKKLSKADFDARVAELDADKVLNAETSGDVTSLSCGADCKVLFTFQKGNFVSVDYKALSELSPSATFAVSKPSPFQFETK